jgi:hypothetical protein
MILKTDLLDVKDHEIDFHGEIFKIPGEIPTELYFKLLEKNQSGSNIDGFRDGINTLYEIFKIRQPELTKEKYDSLITINKYTAIINLILADMTVEETMERLKEVKDSLKDGKKKPLQAEN